MTPSATSYGTTWWAKNLNEVDTEVARLATLCNVRILDPGVIDRVLKNDESVCGTNNPVGFKKLRTMLMMHYHVRDQAVQSVGQATTGELVQRIVADLRERIGERLGTPGAPPG